MFLNPGWRCRMTYTAQLGLLPDDLGYGPKADHMASRVNDTYSDIIIVRIWSHTKGNHPEATGGGDPTRSGSPGAGKRLPSYQRGPGPARPVPAQAAKWSCPVRKIRAWSLVGKAARD